MNPGGKITLNIESVNSEGEGVARPSSEGGFVVFVPGALPGERVLCRVKRVSRNYAAASVLEILDASPDRVSPRCPSYGRCGGCQLQHASYGAQIGLKRVILRDAMRRIGKMDVPDDIPCAPSSCEWGCRNKTTLPAGRVTGFYERRSHRIVPFAGCPVLKPPLEKLVHEIISAHAGSGLKGYDERQGSGDIRAIAVRSGTRDDADELLVGVVAAREPDRRQFGALRNTHQRLMAFDRRMKGSVLSIKTARDNFIWGPVFRQICGAGSVNAGLGDYVFKLDISSFFQINPGQAERIFSRVRSALRDVSAQRALELYSGIGGLTVYIASVCESVDAVEEWRPAVKLRRENMELNGAGGVRAFSESAESFMGGSDLKPGVYDAIVLDPPRTGAPEQVTSGIKRISPGRIIYVSCNPATLARDVLRLAEDGQYSVTGLEAYDMFPQTSHVECLCVMDRNR
ncbi:MAG: 23S rRNA (uracil(1939)-C(5))-methyltransferase RlmD [Synergistaceae bacterium]|jgi:23S rRNA (uracil1939-C5)-methyltransferase|nr:23S rRNA (uracil(1939)-C(5))-methyltransferase RlmD [Synergistaceae bacterium]